MKTIVYLTINTINKKIYIGIHDTDTDKFDGYLGNGVYDNDKSSYEHCKTPFEYAIKKYGVNAFKRITLKVFDNREDAIKMEKEIVNKEFILRKDTYNIALGGGDPPRWNIINCYQYDLNGKFIKEFDSYTSAGRSVNKCSSTIKNACKEKISCSGFYFLTERYDSIDVNKMKKIKEKSSKKVYCYNIKGDFIESFISITETARIMNTTTNVIYNCIYNQVVYNDKYFSLKKMDNFIGKQKYDSNKKTIHQYSLNGEYIESYESCTNAAVKLKKSNSKISIAAKKGKQSCGFLWSYDKVEKLPKYTKKITRTNYGQKPIGLYDLNLKLIKRFDSMKDCLNEYPGFKHALNKNRIAYKAYYFKTIES